MDNRGQKVFKGWGTDTERTKISQLLCILPNLFVEVFLWFVWVWVAFKDMAALHACKYTCRRSQRATARRNLEICPVLQSDQKPFQSP